MFEVVERRRGEKESLRNHSTPNTPSPHTHLNNNNNNKKQKIAKSPISAHTAFEFAIGAAGPHQVGDAPAADAAALAVGAIDVDIANAGADFATEHRVLFGGGD